ncbi:MAG: hypothetical protein ABSG64_04885 [Solirubrobacteraceae bacterium]|jgi:hypothetical protein
MEDKNGRSRFLLLPEQCEPSVSAKQPVLRRYSLARIPAQRADPLPARRPGPKRTRG